MEAAAAVVGGGLISTARENWRLCLVGSLSSKVS